MEGGEEIDGHELLQDILTHNSEGVRAQILAQLDARNGLMERTRRAERDAWISLWWCCKYSGAFVWFVLLSEREFFCSSSWGATCLLALMLSLLWILESFKS